MAKSTSEVFKFQVAPEKLLEIVTSPEFQVAREKNMGSLEARVEETSRSDDQLCFDVHTVDYARGVTGVDRSKTENNRTEYKWNLKAKKSEWIYHSAQSKMVDAWGSVTITADGDNSKLTNEFNVKVKVPLVGGKVEKMVLKEVAKSWPKYEETVLQFI